MAVRDFMRQLPDTVGRPCRNCLNKVATRPPFGSCLQSRHQGHLQDMNITHSFTHTHTHTMRLMCPLCDSQDRSCVCIYFRYLLFTHKTEKKRRRPRAASDLIRATLVNRHLEPPVKLNNAFSDLSHRCSARPPPNIPPSNNPFADLHRSLLTPLRLSSQLHSPPSLTLAV